MAFLSSQVENVFSYSTSDCFSAIIAAAKRFERVTIKTANRDAGVIQLNVSPAMTSFTLGDIVTVTLSANADGTTKMTIVSTAKVPSILAPVQQNKNIQSLVNAFTEEISAYSPISPPAKTPPSPVAMRSPKERLASLSELHDAGVISDEEYEQKRADILASL